MTGIHSRFRDEFGPLVKFPSILRQGSFLFSFDPSDFELIFRTEGKWPIRRGLDTFIYFIEQVRPDVFKGNSGLINEQDEAWRTLRTKLNPIMMQPSVVRSYIPQLDAVACDFLNQIQALTDRSSEMPTSFGSYLNKWALESVGVIALNQRLGVLTESSADAKLFHKLVQDFFRVTNGLSLLPSLSRYVKTPNFRAQIRAFDKLTKYDAYGGPINTNRLYNKNVFTALPQNISIVLNVNSIIRKLIKVPRCLRIYCVSIDQLPFLQHWICFWPVSIP